MARTKKTKKKSARKVSLLTLASFAPVTFQTVKGFQQGGLQNAVAVFSRNMTGYDPQANSYDWRNMQTGLFPIVGVAIAKKVLGRLGVTRALSMKGVPVTL